ncbi:MAG: thioredoxin family protein [Verrucomicrobiaceae bacterium]|nr:MAG: thioredoxin family protein [Verrucomicrobiaceae bacterium]
MWSLSHSSSRKVKLGSENAADKSEAATAGGSPSSIQHIVHHTNRLEGHRGKSKLGVPMKKLFPKLLAALLAAVVTTSAALGAAGWDDDYEKAVAKAKAEKKMVLLDFTGSDWCGWCIRLDKEVFSKKQFKDYAKENLVLVEVDFPQGKRQSKKVKEQNAKLQQEHGVKGYPTIIVLSPEGQKVGQLGYMEGGPEPFIAKLNELKDK